MRIHKAVIAALALLTPAVPAGAEAPVQVMVLGSYHFGNPGRDLNNMKADDVLAPARQRELEALAESLAAFRPTKIMVEAEPSAPDMRNPPYAKFTPAMLASERNEIVQIAFRLAHRLGHDAVYDIDEQPGAGEPDYFPFGPVMEAASANGQMPVMEKAMAEAAAATKAAEERQPTQSIPAMLVYNNDPAGFAAGIGGYYEVLGIGNLDDQPGAVLNAMWYMRNAKIFGKLMKAAQPGDRVLVVYGSGHGYWLRHFASETRGYENVDPLPYLRAAAEKLD